MKKILLILLVFLSLNGKAQNLNQNELVRISNFQSPVPSKFRLYPTTNMWTFLRLNTTNGKIDMVVYDLTNINQGVLSLNDKPLVENGIIDRFTLQPTPNIWTFILLDQVEGDVYKVHWGKKAEERFIEPIL